MRASTAAILFSLSIHAALGYKVLPGMLQEEVPPQEPIQISVVSYEKPPVREPVVSIPKHAAKLVAKPAPALPVKIPKTISLPAAKILPKSEARPVAQQQPKSAVDFMTDPQKGKIFFNYFGKLKERIHTHVRRKYSHTDSSLGVVTLYFVLNPDGFLARSGVLEKESDAGADLQRIALESLKRSAPFEVFPKDLGNGPVAFNLKIYFNDLE